jgi:putative heme iron utilization protein
MKVLTGHLTATNKIHIKALLKAKLYSGKVNTINYLLRQENDTYTVFVIQKDNSILIGEKIRKSKATFKI